MLVAAEYPFLEILWTMIIFFAWVIWIWIAITVLVDLFRRHDIGGWQKAAWVVFVIVLPFLGVLVYLISQHEGMRERTMAQAQAQKKELDQYVRETAGGSAAEIAKAKELLDAGTITQAEFEAIKAKAISGS
jgi:Phospholipase_D-nuclease N-terminal/Short C-terminal domain